VNVWCVPDNGSGNLGGPNPGSCFFTQIDNEIYITTIKSAARIGTCYPETADIYMALMSFMQQIIFPCKFIDRPGSDSRSNAAESLSE